MARFRSRFDRKRKGMSKAYLSISLKNSHIPPGCPVSTACASTAVIASRPITCIWRFCSRMSRKSSPSLRASKCAGSTDRPPGLLPAMRG